MHLPLDCCQTGCQCFNSVARDSVDSSTRCRWLQGVQSALEVELQAGDMLYLPAGEQQHLEAAKYGRTSPRKCAAVQPGLA